MCDSGQPARAMRPPGYSALQPLAAAPPRPRQTWKTAPTMPASGASAIAVLGTLCEGSSFSPPRTRQTKTGSSNRLRLAKGIAGLPGYPSGSRELP